jgi:hypothetical protein
MAKVYPTHRISELLWAWLAATLLSGIPSTVYALVTGGDVTEATRAAGAMLFPPQSPLWKLVLAAAIVHPLVSLFWAALLSLLLPARHTVLWALAASVAIALIDLELIATRFFPEVAALAFWPQLADHLMWGLVLGAVLQWRRSRHPY